MSIVRWNALRDLDSWAREMASRGLVQADGDFTPAADVLEEKGAYRIKLDLPGVAKEDVKVDLIGDILTVRGEKKAERQTEDDCLCSERTYGSFSRSFRLPEHVESDKIGAEFKDGVLTLTAPKSEKAKARTIAIQ